MDRKGFTLIEILISFGILALMAGVGFSYFGNYRNVANIDAEASKIANYLKEAQSRANTGQESSSWGVRFFNSDQVGEDYYELFKGESYLITNVYEKHYLNSRIDFGNPPVGSTTDIIFYRLTNMASPSSISIFSSIDANLSRSFDINSFGNINY